MFERGLVEETRAILARGSPRSAKPFESLGYKQALMVCDGREPLESAVEDTQLQTRRYAKRQWTWFRREPDIEWIPGFGEDPTVQRQAIERVGEFLG